MQRALWGCSALLFVATGARADDTGAQAQFDYGLAEMTAGRYSTGCPALEASAKTEPRLGTVFTLAECQLKWGHLASALAGYKRYLDAYELLSPPDKAKQETRHRIAALERDELEASVPRLTVRLTPRPPALPSAVVTCDESPLDGATLGAALPLDPGEHVVRTTLSDGRAREERVTLAKGDKKTLIAKSPDQDDIEALPQAAPVVPTEPEAHHGHLGLTIAAAGVTVAAIGVAAVTGGLALSDKGAATDGCHGAVCTSQSAANAGNDAHTFANVETVSLIVASVALAATAVLYFTEPKSKTAATARLLASQCAGGLRW
jgi:hypothetical protein